jgi:hypothetical protein
MIHWWEKKESWVEKKKTGKSKASDIYTIISGRTIRRPQGFVRQ